MGMTMKDLHQQVQITMDHADAERRKLTTAERKLYALLDEYTNT
jgi:hypothetical protein